MAHEIEQLRGTTHATIRAAFNQAKEICCEHGDLYSANISSITTKIIQDAGRFSERWAGDVLFHLDHIRSMAERAIGGNNRFGVLPFDEIICFGLRADGSDHGAYIMKNLIDSADIDVVSHDYGYVYPERVYRRILAVRCRAWADPDYGAVRTEFSLRDLTHKFSRIQKSDLVYGTGLPKLAELPLENKASPEPEEKYRIDKTAVEKAMAEKCVKFDSRPADPEELKRDGCLGGFHAVTDILGYYGAPVPAERDKGVLVCRIYVFEPGRYAVAWRDDWYREYGEVAALVGEATRAG